MDSLSPFRPFFEQFGRPGAPTADGVNSGPQAELEQALRVPLDSPGRSIMLRAPRAGFGKTYALEAVRQRLAGSHEFIPLRPVDTRDLDSRAAVEDALRRLTRQLPAGNGVTVLDLHARCLLAHALQPLVRSGEVPCQDREAALAALRERPVETFDFHHPQAVTAHWTRENFEILGPRLSLEISRTTQSPLNQVAQWLAALFRYAATAPENPVRAGTLIQAMAAKASVDSLGTLLALISCFQRVVLVLDDLEGLHGNVEAARRAAAFVTALRQEAPRADAVLSLNHDVWESAFVPALSGGLRDRLSEIVIRFEPLSDATLRALLDSRLAGRGEEILRRLNLGPNDRYARRVLQLAAEIYGGSAPAAADVPTGPAAGTGGSSPGVQRG